ncbi:MAG: hypothetical protein IPM63_04075 [Acidobacteriota bacterium]|nr:MAG: hypothetical protein IPM63_04075 [Acidobacteriota bacterium]
MKKLNTDRVAGSVVAAIVAAAVNLAVYFLGPYQMLADRVSHQTFPESRFGYTKIDLEKFFGNLVVEACDIPQEFLQAYANLQYLDIAVAAMSALVLASLIWTFVDSAEHRGSSGLLIVLPASMFVCEIAENLFLGYFAGSTLRGFNSDLVAVGSAVTQAKWIFVSMSAISVVFLAARHWTARR